MEIAVFRMPLNWSPWFLGEYPFVFGMIATIVEGSFIGGLLTDHQSVFYL